MAFGLGMSMSSAGSVSSGCTLAFETYAMSSCGLEANATCRKLQCLAEISITF